jgi:pyridoxine 4-dehydrogenase
LFSKRIQVKTLKPGKHEGVITAAPILLINSEMISLSISAPLIAALLSTTSVAEGLETLFGANKGNKTPVVGRVSAGPTTEISSMGCGTWSWGNRFLFDYDPSQDEEIYEAYREVRNAGVTLFDTADSYGTLDLNGRAEILLGNFERRYLEEIGMSGDNDEKAPWWDFAGNIPTNNNYRPQQVATKLAPYPWRITPGNIVRSAEGSLRRLEQPKLSIAQLHWSTANYQPFQEQALREGICDVYDKGLCDAVGVSNYGPKQLFSVADKFRERNVPLAIAQVQYSLMTFSDNGGNMNEACDEVDCRLISYSPLCLGLLTGKYTLKETNRLPKSKARQQLFRELLPGAQGLLDTLEVIAQEYDKSQSQVAINWCMCKGTVPIPGGRTLAQARENLGATGWSLRPDAVLELETAASKVTKPMVQNVFQTE